MYLKSLFTTLIILNFTFTANTHAQIVQWAKNGGGDNNDRAYSVAIDGSGNSYVAGNFESPTITFGSTVLTNADPGSKDLFLTKYSPTGAVLWALGFGGATDDYLYAVTTDAAGNVYIAGNFASPSITFGSFTLTNPLILSDLFLVKLNSSGTVLWARSTGVSTNAMEVRSLSLDASGNLYVAGAFNSTTLEFGTTILTNASTSTDPDIFLAKYNAAGTFVWAKSAGGNQQDNATSVATDASGNVYVTGYFNSTSIVFGATTLTHTGFFFDMFLVKYDASGNVLWAKNTGSYDAMGNGVATDATGNVYVTGGYSSSTITFGTSPTLTNAGNVDGFLTKYNSSGGVVWAKNIGSTNREAGNSVHVDGSGNVYVTGYFYSPTLVIGTTTLTNSALSNMFVAKYTSAGAVSFAIRGTSYDSYGEIGGAAITTTASGANMYVTGYFIGDSCSFGSTKLFNSGNVAQSEPFIVKYATSTTGVPAELLEPGKIAVYPSPNNGTMTLQLNGGSYSRIIIYDNIGRLVYNTELSGTENKVDIDLQDRANGIYFLNAAGPGCNNKCSFEINR